MEPKLQWLSEEEGTITFLEQKKEWMRFQFFVISDEEAELKMHYSEIVETTNEIENISNEIILKMMECVIESFRLLWEEGYEETILVERSGSLFGKILDSTKVVRKMYSEYMMQRGFCLETFTKENLNIRDNSNNLNIIMEEEGFACENESGTFFCRLLPYEEKKETGRSFYLYEVEVDEAERNKGIATTCLKQLFSLLSKEAPATILLQVGSYNEPAVHLYEKLGFEIQEELCCYVPEE